MNLHEAANVAWHIRVNGLDGVTPENIKRAMAVLEQLAEREKLVKQLIEAIDNLDPDDVGGVLQVVASLQAGTGMGLVSRLVDEVRDFKVGGEP